MKKLFKYLGPENCLKTLQSRKVRFSPPNELNDPFECLPSTALLSDPKWIADVKRKIIAHQINEQNQRAENERRSPSEIERNIELTWEKYYEQLMPQFRQAAYHIMNDHRKRFRVLCLTGVAPEDAESILLWGHYSSGHRGASIELDPCHHWFSTFPDGFRARVNYQPNRCGWIVSDEHPEGVAHGGELLFTKSFHWEYEQEFRLVLPEESSRLDKSSIDSLVDIPMAAIRSVTLGANSDEELRTRVIAICAQPDYSHIAVRLVRPHSDEFGFEVSG